MSKHWRPDDKIVPIGRGRNWARPDWVRSSSYLAPRVRRATPGPSGVVVGVVLAAAACAGIAVGLSQASRPRAEVKGSPSTSPGRTAGMAGVSFGLCHSGGGTNCVVDGDTFYIGGEKVRIAGIDAPETHPPGCAEEAQLGEAATDKLRALLNSGAVTLTPLGTGIHRDRDVYGRLLRNVAVDGADVGEAMIGAEVAREYAGGRRPWC